MAGGGGKCRTLKDSNTIRADKRGRFITELLR